VQNVRAGSLQTVVTPVAVHAGEVGELFGMASEIDLVVRLVKAAKGGKQFTLVASFEAGARNCVEQAVRPVSVG
jgi:hypothetical protein